MNTFVNKYQKIKGMKSETMTGFKGLLQAEIYKLWRSKPFWVILTVIAVYSVIQVGLVYFVQSSKIAAQQGAELSKMMNFESLGQNGVLMAGSASLILSICIAAFSGLFVASEFQQHTVCDALALGKNRTYVYLSKLVALAVAAALFLAVSMLVCTVGLTLLNGFGEIPLMTYIRQALTCFSMYFRLFCTFAAVACMIAFLCRSAGVSTVLGAAYALVTAILMSFLASFDALSFMIKGLPQYYIMALGQSDDMSFYAAASAVSAIYIIVPCLIGIAFFCKTDVK
jgi:ABC-2 type transport system permease protein